MYILKIVINKCEFMFFDKNQNSLLSLMQLMSATFPVGGFSYSRGLEWAVEYGWVNSLENFINWQKQWINGQLLYLEWPMIIRCYHYIEINDAMQFFKCASQILSYRDTYEMRLEEQQRGKAITQLILQWYAPVNKYWLLGLECSGVAAIAWLGYMWKIPIEKLALGYAYNILECSIMVGLKLVPFGQKTAQKLLRYLSDFIINNWSQAVFIKDDELGSSFPLQSIASACHETQYSRLFCS